MALKQQELEAEIQLKSAQLGADITRSVNIPSVG
jgi:hypothetical protein